VTTLRHMINMDLERSHEQDETLRDEPNNTLVLSDEQLECVVVVLEAQVVKRKDACCRRDLKLHTYHDGCLSAEREGVRVTVQHKPLRRIVADKE
jgi:hypothetical protein